MQFSDFCSLQLSCLTAERTDISLETLVLILLLPLGLCLIFHVQTWRVFVQPIILFEDELCLN